MASKIKQKILEELALIKKHSKPSEYKSALLDGMAQKIYELDNDRDIRNVLWANRELTSRSFTNDEFSAMSQVAEIVMGEPGTGVVNFEKSFGKDWKEKFNDIPLSKIQFIADKNGLNWQDLQKEMQAEVIRSNREDIAHGRWDPNQSLKENIKGEIGGTLLSVFGRRQQEAIARGEDPAAKDYIGDIAENSMYAIPWGRAIGAGGKAAAALQYAASNAVAPVASEAYDAIAYDNDNPRGEFSGWDVAGGIGTNIAAPVLLRQTVGRATRYVPGLKEFSQRMGEVNQPKTQEILRKELMNPKSAEVTKKALHTKDVHGVKLTERQQDIADLYQGDEAYDAYWRVRRKLRAGEPLDKADRAVAAKYPDLQEARYINEAPTERVLRSEESLKNILTNEYGAQDNNRAMINRVPIAGPWLNQKLEEEEEEEKERKRREEIERKWKIRFGER